MRIKSTGGPAEVLWAAWPRRQGVAVGVRSGIETGVRVVHDASPAREYPGSRTMADETHDPAKAQNAAITVQAALDALDEMSGQWESAFREGQEFRCRRSGPRRPFRTSCQVWFLDSDGIQVHRRSAQTRNLSERGIGLLVGCEARRGTPIEIRIEAPGRPPTYLGGVVTGCRKTLQGFHEIGVQLRMQQKEPIFSEDPVRAVAHLPWVQYALRCLAQQDRSGTTSATRAR